MSTRLRSAYQKSCGQVQSNLHRGFATKHRRFASVTFATAMKVTVFRWLSVVVVDGPSHMVSSPKTACNHATQIASAARTAFEESCDGIEGEDLWLPAVFEPCLIREVFASLIMVQHMQSMT